MNADFGCKVQLIPGGRSFSKSNTHSFSLVQRPVPLVACASLHDKASGAGALGVRLGEANTGDESLEAAEIEVGEPADVDFMQSAVGLVWRALLLWMSLLLLMSFAGLVGG